MTGSINGLLVPVFNIVVSYLVVRFSSVDLWGEFVGIMILVQFGAHIVSWGSKEYLLRAFSRSPSNLADSWGTVFASRIPLLLIVWFVLVILVEDSARKTAIVVWVAALMLHQSHEGFVIFRRAFILAAIAELVTTVFRVGLILWIGEQLTVSSLITLFAATQLLKAVILVAYFWNEHWVSGSPWKSWRIEPRYFGAAFPFFLLGFSGMVQSQVALYSVITFLSERDVGRYQVFINLMIYLQSIANFLVLPFVKVLYRLTIPAIRRLSFRLFAFGLLILPAGLAGSFYILNEFYMVAMGWESVILGGFIVLPVYAYLPIIYALYRADRQIKVVQMDLFGTLASLLLSTVLIPRIGLQGALAAGASAQCLMLAGYLYLIRELDRQPLEVTGVLPGSART